MFSLASENDYSKRMKILFAIKSLSVPAGGAERVFVEVVNGLASRGHDIEIMTFDREPSSFYDLNSKVPRADLNLLDPWSSFGVFDFLYALPKIRRFVVQKKPDIVVAFMHSTYIPVGLALFKVKINLIASEHTDYAHFQNRPLQRFLKGIIDRRALIRTVPSETVRQNFISNGGVDALTVPNPVNVVCKSPKIQMTDSVPNTRLLSVGRLMEEKDHLTLIEAFASIRSDFPNWELRIVGDGPLRQQLESRVKELGLCAYVQFVGVVRDVEREYSRAAFVVLPSRYEAFGMVAAESLACGTAVLSFAECSGIAEIVESGRNGLLVIGGASRVSRTAALADGLRKLMMNPGLSQALGEAGPETVSRFAPSEIITLWEKVLGLAVKNKVLDRNEIGEAPL